MDQGIGILPLTAPGYPPALRALGDPPPVLFWKGRRELLGAPAVAIVGARRATGVGRRAAETMGRILSEAGVTVVSGMALGIDGEAHRGALRGGGNTLAVLGSGLQVPYPASHRTLFHEIEERGLLVSEFLPDESARPHHFPKRNRIIAALSRAVVVVEAGRKSGALITVDHGLDLGRDILAIPGSVENPQAVGSNSLLRDGARVLPDPAGILEELVGLGFTLRERGVGSSPGPAHDSGVPHEFSDLWTALSVEPRAVDELARQADLPVRRSAGGPLGPRVGRVGQAVSGHAIPAPSGHEVAVRRVTPAPGLIRSVYVHAPFCARRCFYCDFAVTVSSLGDLPAWLRALEREMALAEAEGSFLLDAELDTLFVGGGTPSLLGAGAMAGLARVLGKDRLVGSDLEWTAEANPDSFTLDLARGWADAGVNRISLGVQSFQAPVLRWLHRLHGPEEAKTAVGTARKVGIQNINLDLIFGLPREVERDWREDLDAALSQEVPHLSLYGLSVEKGTPLSRAVEGGEVTPPDEEDYREQFLVASERLTSEGYRHYEVSNFALPGLEARHNLAYWSLAPYLGLGNSAHSFLFPRRRWNLRDWDAYQQAAAGREAVWEAEEELTEEAVRLERIWLGLRTDGGIPLSELQPAARSLVEGWVSGGYATLVDGVLRLTRGGWLILDELVVELDLEQERSGNELSQDPRARARHPMEPGSPTG